MKYRLFFIYSSRLGGSKWICGHDQMNSKTDNAFNDPFCVRTLIFEVRRKILRGKKIQKIAKIVLVSNKTWRI